MYLSFILGYFHLHHKDMTGFEEGECQTHAKDLFLPHWCIFIALVVLCKNSNDLKSQAFVSICHFVPLSNKV